MRMLGVPLEVYDAVPGAGFITYLSRMVRENASPETTPLGVALDNSLVPAFILYHASAVAVLGHFLR